MDCGGSVPIKRYGNRPKDSTSSESPSGDSQILSVARAGWALFKSTATGRNPFIAALERRHRGSGVEKWLRSFLLHPRALL